MDLCICSYYFQAKQSKTNLRKFGLSTELINQIFVYHSPTDAAPQFLQKLIPKTNLHVNTVSIEKLIDFSAQGLIKLIKKEPSKIWLYQQTQDKSGIGLTEKKRTKIATAGDQGPVSRKPRNLSGDIILFVSSKRRCSVTRNFAVILIFIPFTTFEKSRFTE